MVLNPTNPIHTQSEAFVHANILLPAATAMGRFDSFKTVLTAWRRPTSVPGAPTTFTTTGRTSSLPLILEWYGTSPMGGMLISGAPRIGDRNSWSSADCSAGDSEMV